VDRASVVVCIARSRLDLSSGTAIFQSAMVMMDVLLSTWRVRMWSPRDPGLFVFLQEQLESVLGSLDAVWSFTIVLSLIKTIIAASKVAAFSTCISQEFCTLSDAFSRISQQH
jgi:hypothetical protein